VNVLNPRSKAATSTQNYKLKPKDTNFRKIKERVHKNVYNISLLLLTAEISTVKYSSYENMEDSPTDVT
jgi:hypothetical protein